MKITLILTGKTTEKNISSGIEDYAFRINKYCGFEMVIIPDMKNTKNMPFNEQKMKEGKKIIQSLNSDDYVILLDERGREMRTKDFSDFLSKTLMIPKKRIVFVIGGPWGFSEEVHDRADYKLSLSKMTFPHQMVRLLFLEQLYRAFTIIKGEPYHHE
jgi:23S rRNA (pseudouridine1915-N3)-methyltransferase